MKGTFHGKVGISVVDYAICDRTLFSHILNFTVKEPTYLSDDSPPVTWLCTNTDIRNQDTSPESDTLTRLPKQFMWESDSTPKFKAALQSPNLQMIIQEYLSDINSAKNVNTSAEQVEIKILITTAKWCLKIRTTRRHKRTHSLSNKK